ncbi:hypothetical protein Y032_0129g1516 [Ancylostoma ceylanicum]|uniref:Uncharacterized protein n=1 Tax=Ancylostoma ceylanicum TaxID=53326 RepID=A0A016T7L1_9BILA|nr:hypothetical protein Y032_0129g1516 [Ancylostoma ceylanicum]
MELRQSLLLLRQQLRQQQEQPLHHKHPQDRLQRVRHRRQRLRPLCQPESLGLKIQIYEASRQLDTGTNENIVLHMRTVRITMYTINTAHQEFTTFVSRKQPTSALLFDNEDQEVSF